MISIWRVPSHHLPGYYLALDSSGHGDCLAQIKDTLVGALGHQEIKTVSGGNAGLGLISISFEVTEGKISIFSDGPEDYSIISDSISLLERFVGATKGNSMYVWCNS